MNIRINCPQCQSSLQAPPQFVGRTVKCPKCSLQFVVPAPADPDVVDAAVAPSGGGGAPPFSAPFQPMQSPQAPSFSAPQYSAPQFSAPAFSPAANSPAEYGAAAPTGSQGSGDATGGRTLFFEFTSPTPLAFGVRQAIFDKVKEVLDDELLGFRVVDVSPSDTNFHSFGGAPTPTAPVRLGPGDVRLNCQVVTFDYGNRALRYLVPIIPLFGPWACKLAVNVSFSRHDGQDPPFLVKAHQGMGVFGGAGENLMKVNMKAVAKNIAYRLTRAISGRWLINRVCYDFAFASLLCGLFGLIPFVGLILGLFLGMSFGGIALQQMIARQLPKRRWLAILGLVVCLLSVAAQIGWISLVMQAH